MKKIVALSGLISPLTILAHSGHGPVNDGFAHYVLSPAHLIGVLLAVAVGIGIYRYAKDKKEKNA